MSGEPSGSLNSSRRSSPLRATFTDSDGMPTALSPPEVSMLNMSVELYLSGSCVLIVGPVFSEVALKLPVFEFELAFVFAFKFEFEFVPLVSILQPPAIASRLKRQIVPTIIRSIFFLVCIDTSLKRLTTLPIDSLKGEQSKDSMRAGGFGTDTPSPELC